MKLLIDSCVWSLSLRRRKAEALIANEQIHLEALTDAIQHQRVVIIGPIRQEVLSGIKDPAQFEKVRNALSGFRDQPLATHHFENAAKLFNLCRSRGVECGSTDILICAVAVEMQSAILTFDQGLMRCIRVLKNEGVMS